MNFAGVQATDSAEELWANIDGARMRYLRCGSGPAIVLVHGLLGYSFSWRFNMPVLAKQFSVYAVDMLGAGFSDCPPDLEACLRASAERLLRFLDAVKIPACDLLGTSRGGAVVMMAAAIAPDRIRRLILVGPVNPWSARGKRRVAFFGNLVTSAIFRRVAPRLELVRGLVLRRLYADKHRIPAGTLEGYSAPLATRGTLEHGLRVLRTWTQDLRELESILPRISHIPTLLLWGSQDVAVDPASADPLSKCFQSCRLVSFSGVGHLPYEEAPDDFNRAVLAFLTQA